MTEGHVVKATNQVGDYVDVDQSTKEASSDMDIDEAGAGAEAGAEAGADTGEGNTDVAVGSSAETPLPTKRRRPRYPGCFKRKRAKSKQAEMDDSAVQLFAAEDGRV